MGEKFNIIVDSSLPQDTICVKSNGMYYVVSGIASEPFLSQKEIQNESEGVSMNEEKRIRKPDSDLVSYLYHNTDIFALEDIHTIHAEVPGHNDEDDWYWIIELKDGRFLLTEAWCDFTGWDCQSGGSSQVAESAHAAAMLAPEPGEGYTGRAVRRNLLDQLSGMQPFGLETHYNV